MGHGRLRPDLTRSPLLPPISPTKAVRFGEEKRKRAEREREKVRRKSVLTLGCWIALLFQNEFEWLLYTNYREIVVERLR